MVYRLIRLCGIFLIELFFRRVSRRGVPLEESGPLLVVANHPNFLFDPMLLGFVFKRPLWFLAKGTLFTTPLLAAFFRLVHMVPIYRRQDSPSDMTKNTDSFAFASRCLQAGRAIALFPEGVSKGERSLSDIKTGAARIALQTESESACNLRIQPLGITYADLREFQTTVTLHAGEPIAVEPFLKVYQEDERAAVQQLTSAIDDALRSVTVEIVEQEDRELAELLGKLYSSRGFVGDDRRLLAEIAQNIEILGEDNSNLKEHLLTRLRWYVSLAEALSLDPSRATDKKPGLFLLAALPFIVVGIIFHLLPYRLVGTLVRRKRVTVETATMKLAFGLILFLAWYAGWAVLLGYFLPTTFQAAAALVSLVVSGFFALKWTHDMRLYLSGSIVPGTGKARATLEHLGDELYEDCERLRMK